MLSHKKKKMKIENENENGLAFHVIFGVGEPTAKHGSLASSLNVAMNVSSNDAILAGTLSLGMAMMLFDCCPSPIFVLAVTQNSYGLFDSSPDAS